jgi:hypothetical protein
MRVSLSIAHCHCHRTRESRKEAATDWGAVEHVGTGLPIMVGTAEAGARLYDPGAPVGRLERGADAVRLPESCRARPFAP